MDQLPRDAEYSGELDTVVWASTPRLTSPSLDLPPRSKTAHQDRPFSEKIEISRLPDSLSINYNDFPSPVRTPNPPPLPPQSTITSPPSAPSPTLLPCSTFLSIPPEIRRQIYLELPDTRIKKPLIYCVSPFSGRKQHPLARVCKQTRFEILSLLYSQNTWVMKLEYRDFYDAFCSWIQKVAEHATHLRILQISLRSVWLTTLSPLCWDHYTAEEIEKVVEGDAMFEVDLSQKWKGGKVRTMRSDGFPDQTEFVRGLVADTVKEIWHQKYSASGLAAQDIVTLAHQLMELVGTRWFQSKDLQMAKA